MEDNKNKVQCLICQERQIWEYELNQKNWKNIILTKINKMFAHEQMMPSTKKDVGGTVAIEASVNHLIV